MRRGWEQGEALAAGRVPVSLSVMTLQRKLGSCKEGKKTKTNTKTKPNQTPETKQPKKPKKTNQAKQNREGTCIKRRRISQRERKTEFI